MNASKGNKSYLPQKNCLGCGRPFTWRKKWEKSWNDIKYCSERCRNHKKHKTGSANSNS